MLIDDMNDLPMTASEKSSVAAYDEAAKTVLYFRNPRKILDAATLGEPDFVMGHVFIGYLELLMLDTDLASSVEERSALIDQAIASRKGITEREKMHVGVFHAFKGRDMAQASQILDEILDEYPNDILALYMGHEMDFFLGDGENMQNRVAKVLPAWDEDHPLYGFLLGMMSFGLEESHHYRRAEEYGLRAVERDAHNVWGIHAVAHALEMLGEFDKGDAFMHGLQKNWTENNFFTSHNAIHSALFKLEQDDVAGVVDLYDSFIFTENSPPISMAMVDGSSALWRLHLEREDVGNRWEILAQGWKHKAFQAYYSFNDMHAMMAFVASGDNVSGDKLISTLQEYLADDGNSRNSNYTTTRDVGLPICKALRNYGRGNYQSVIDALMPIRKRFQTIGGSHAQRDVVERTILESCLRGGQKSVAEGLIRERLVERPRSTYNLKKQKELAAI